MWSPKIAIMVFQLGATFLYFREVLCMTFGPVAATEFSRWMAYFFVTVHGFFLYQARRAEKAHSRGRKPPEES